MAEYAHGADMQRLAGIVEMLHDVKLGTKLSHETTMWRCCLQDYPLTEAEKAEHGITAATVTGGGPSP